MAAEGEGCGGDDLRLIEISAPLPCGISGCGQMTRRARIERDPERAALYLLLPLCDAHLRSLSAAAGATPPADDACAQTAPLP